MSSSVSMSAATTVKTRKRKLWGMASAIWRTARTVIGALKCKYILRYHEKFSCPSRNKVIHDEYLITQMQKSAEQNKSIIKPQNNILNRMSTSGRELATKSINLCELSYELPIFFISTYFTKRFLYVKGKEQQHLFNSMKKKC